MHRNCRVRMQWKGQLDMQRHRYLRHVRECGDGDVVVVAAETAVVVVAETAVVVAETAIVVVETAAEVVVVAETAVVVVVVVVAVNIGSNKRELCGRK